MQIIKRMRLISAKWGFILKDKFRNKKNEIIISVYLEGRREGWQEERGRKEEEEKRKQ